MDDNKKDTKYICTNFGQKNNNSEETTIFPFASLFNKTKKWTPNLWTHYLNYKPLTAEHLRKLYIIHVLVN